MMNNIFWNIIVEDIMIIYLDNILIFIQTLEEYYKAIYMSGLQEVDLVSFHLCSSFYFPLYFLPFCSIFSM